MVVLDIFYFYKCVLDRQCQWSAGDPTTPGPRQVCKATNVRGDQTSKIWLSVYPRVCLSVIYIYIYISSRFSFVCGIFCRLSPCPRGFMILSAGVSLSGLACPSRGGGGEVWFFWGKKESKQSSSE